MRVLLWHVHGGWTDAFVRGGHEYLLPATADRGAWGLGRGGRAWPPNVIEVAPGELADQDVDIVVLQRPEELVAVERLLGRRPGTELPAVYVEHNLPRGDVPVVRHPLADRDDILLVHVTAFNSHIWDSGRAPVRVIEHGLPDPGRRYDGRLPRLAVVGNEPVRRARVLGTDLIPRFTEAAPVDLFGIGVEEVPSLLGLPPDRLRPVGEFPPGGPDGLHARLALRRAYVHPVRWTSLGLSLIEAMLLGMPVLVLATAQAAVSVPDGAGAVSLDVDRLVRQASRLIADPDRAQVAGLEAREAALARFGLARFLGDWEEALEDARSRSRRAAFPRTHYREEALP